GPPAPPDAAACSRSPPRGGRPPLPGSAGPDRSSRRRRCLARGSSAGFVAFLGTGEVEQTPPVPLDDLVRLVVRDVLQQLADVLPAVGPVGVGMRVVALPHDLVDPDLLTPDDAFQVVDQAAVAVPAEQVGGPD